MNDFDYDCWQRKQLAKQALHRVSGAKSKKCPLPTDHMTPAQWRKENGSIVTYNLNRPCSWEDFKLWPRDLQEEYIKKLHEKFNASLVLIAKMMGISAQTLSRNFDVQKLGFTVGGHISPKEREAFMAWIDGETAEAEQEAVEAVSLPPVVAEDAGGVPPVDEADTGADESADMGCLVGGSLTFAPGTTLEQLSRFLMMIYPSWKRNGLTIVIGDARNDRD